MALEAQVRLAIRDAVNRASRKPFCWGGLRGYEQLEAIAQALGEASRGGSETEYLQRLQQRVERVVATYRVNAADLKAAQQWLRQIAACLRYPPPETPAQAAVTSAQIKREMEALLASFQPDRKRKPAQAALAMAWQRIWQAYGADLLSCYDIPGLPPDNLQLEAFFGRLRRQQRRISGRQSTRELRDFGQQQVLFMATSEQDLLEQIRQVPPAQYRQNRQRLEEAEAPRRLLCRLHRDPLGTMRTLVKQHTARRTAIALTSHPPP